MKRVHSDRNPPLIPADAPVTVVSISQADTTGVLGERVAEIFERLSRNEERMDETMPIVSSLVDVTEMSKSSTSEAITAFTEVSTSISGTNNNTPSNSVNLLTSNVSGPTKRKQTFVLNAPAHPDSTSLPTSTTSAITNLTTMVESHIANTLQLPSSSKKIHILISSLSSRCKKMQTG